MGTTRTGNPLSTTGMSVESSRRLASPLRAKVPRSLCRGLLTGLCAAWVLACAGADATDVAESAGELRADSVRVVGSIAYGETKTVDYDVAYNSPAPYRALRVTAAAGDVIVIDVSAQPAQGSSTLAASVRLGDDAFRALASCAHDNGSPGATCKVTHAVVRSGTHYVMLDEYNRRRTTFTVTLSKGTASAGGSSQTPPVETPSWSAALVGETFVGTGAFTIAGGGRSMSGMASMRLSYRYPYNTGTEPWEKRWYVEPFTTNVSAPPTNAAPVNADGSFSLSGAGVGNSSWNSAFTRVEGHMLPGRIARITKFETWGSNAVTPGPIGGGEVPHRDAATSPFEIALAPAR